MTDAGTRVSFDHRTGDLADDPCAANDAVGDVERFEEAGIAFAPKHLRAVVMLGPGLSA